MVCPEPVCADPLENSWDTKHESRDQSREEEDRVALGKGAQLLTLVEQFEAQTIGGASDLPNLLSCIAGMIGTIHFLHSN